MENNLKTLLNLTLHKQGEMEIALARSAGYNLMPEPLAPVVGEGQEGLEAAASQICEVIGRAVAEGASVLIGGHTGALVYALRAIRDEEWPEFVIFETQRVRDASDRFVFQPMGILRIPGG